MPNCDDKQHCVALAVLERRVDQLEDGQRREESFRKTYYEDREARIARDTHLDEQINGMDEKLDKLVKRQEEADAKPNRLLDKLKENSIWMLLAAVLGLLMARIGL